MLLYHFAINANVCAICTCTVNKVNLNLLCGQEVWSEPWWGGGGGGARMVPENGQTTKTKKIFYMLFWLENLSTLLQIYIPMQFLFSKRGVCFYWVACFYWDIYGRYHHHGGGGHFDDMLVPMFLMGKKISSFSRNVCEKIYPFSRNFDKKYTLLTEKST